MDRLKTFVIYLNVYFWERCYIDNDFISNLKLIYKFIDANQKILKEKSQLLSVWVLSKVLFKYKEIHVDETWSHVNWRVNVIKYFWNVSKK